ncbi:MAG: BlaI/MecI/CopY family transcriptional regulator [Bacteroidota bacterium]
MQKKRLTKAEEEIMQLIWKLERCTVSDIRQMIATEQGGNKPPHSSISTIVRILEEKGFIDHKAYGRTYEYFPLVSKEEYSSRTLRKLVTDYFDGSMQNLVSFLVVKEKLDPKELNDLLQDLDPPKEDDHA